jgi:glycosyltransferase involved in cell wall biosynthesis
MVKNKNLCLFTYEFPYGIGETHLESEIPFMNKSFDKIFVFTAFKSDIVARSLPSKFEVITINNDWSPYRHRIFFRNFFFIFKILCLEFLFSRKKSSFLLELRTLKSILVSKINEAELLKDVLIEKGIVDSVFYTYWFSDASTTLSVLKYFKTIKSFISRAHRFDVFEEGGRDRWIPFRNFQLMMVDKVLTDSKKAAEYMIQTRSRYASKISCSYYGVSDNGLNPFSSQETFKIISCSYVHYRKRIHKIVEILGYLNFPVCWVHFGEGVLLDEIIEKTKKLPSNITVEFKGHLPNSEILRYYKSNSINMMLLVSESEGVPMSLVEACSFGIPLFGCNSGGNSEIINTETGMLFSENFNPKEVAELITSFMGSNKNSIEFRKGVREFWKNNFEAEKNYNKFYQEIM